MNSSSTQFVHPRRMGMYEPFHQFGMWGDNLRANGELVAQTSLIVQVDTKLDNQSEDTSNGTLGTPKYDQEASKPYDKVQRRLAQNREAARKSRLRKKAYVQQLESSRVKLMQLEQELDRVRQQGAYVSGGADSSQSGFSGAANTNTAPTSRSVPGIAAFDLEYKQWVEEQNRQVCELRSVLSAQASDVELRILVESGMNHYFKLFALKANAAKVDVFYVMSGLWRSSSERFFLWIGGFRPSELLRILMPQLEDLTDHQLLEICNLKQSCQQTEDALSQGMDRLQQTLTNTVAEGHLGDGSYFPQLARAMERFDDLNSFLTQADHIRQETLRQMSRILNTRQTARGLLALGEYFERLRALSTIWASRPREPA